MDKAEYNKVKKFKYLEYCDYLQNKYGIGLDDYMTPNFNKKKGVTRTKEGLFAHHKMEYKEYLLSREDIAKECPYEYQKKENIVYCDYLEHLLLHFMIYEEYGLGYPGIRFFMKPELDEWFLKDNIPRNGWKKNIYDKIAKDKNVYKLILMDYHEE